MFWKRKKNKKEEESIENYSIQEIEEMTLKAQEERAKFIREQQIQYLQEIDRNIGKRARQGETKFITHACDGFEEYITPSFIQEIADIYTKKGYRTYIVQPDPQDICWQWCRIEWDAKGGRKR